MQFIKGNYIDLAVLLILGYFVVNSFRHNFWVLLADLVAFISSVFVGIFFYSYLAKLLVLNFSIGESVSKSISFLLISIVSETILGILVGFIVGKLKSDIYEFKFSRFFGVFPGFVQGVFVVSMAINLLMTLPIKPSIKVDIENSKSGKVILEKTIFFESRFKEIFGTVAEEALTYITVKPQSEETIKLDVKKYNLSVDSKSESELIAKVNEERRKIAVGELKQDQDLTIVARKYATEMWNGKFFSHYSLEGKSLVDRLKEGGIKYTFAGENLALAPTYLVAHAGLMNSEGHRQNILNTKFKKIGIGVVDNGIYGKIFVQVFTDR